MKPILPLLLFLFWIPAAQAQQPSALGVALDHAWKLHPQAATLDAREAEAHAAKKMADALTPEPARLSVGNLNDRQGKNLGKQEYEVELAMPLWLPGQKNAHTVAATSRMGVAATLRVATQLELAGEVRGAWWTLALARSVKALAERRLTTARALDADSAKRFKVGELSRIDANLAQSERLAAEAELIETKAALLQAEQELRLLTGRAPPITLNEETAKESACTHTHPHAHQDSESLVAHHPQLIAAAATARSARARVKVAEETSRAAPELALRVVRERGNFAESYGNNIGLKLTFPFSSGAKVRNHTSSAQIEADQADADLRRTETRVSLDIERARRKLEATEQQWTTANERRVLLADNLRLTEKAFALGETDLATLLRLRASAYDAESFYERQTIARAAAISRLNQSLGVLP
ncbi:MAG: TolC family protein [Rhodocyclaceae bacterium]|nr:TolC family protein [Rhodocyclaceae bacterium]